MEVFASGDFPAVVHMEDSAKKKSSFSTMLRAAVMLCLLFSIPAIAMFDHPLRKFVRGYLHRGGIHSTEVDDMRKRHGSDAKEDRSTPNGPPRAATNVAGQAQRIATSESFTEPRVATPLQDQAPPSDPGLMPGPHGATQAWSERAPRVASSTQPIQRPPWQDTRPRSDLPEAKTFDTMHRRLEQLGATYYLLETWGRGGELYRFHCKMAIGENPNFTRQFEATDSDPMVAMRRVLDEVESWNAKRRY